METAVSTLSSFNTSKAGIKKYVDQVVNEIKEGVMNPLLAHLYIKSMQKSLEGISDGINAASVVAVSGASRKEMFNGPTLSL